MSEKVKNFRSSQIVNPDDSYLVSHDTEIVNLTSGRIAVASRTGHRAVQLKDRLGKVSLNVIEIYDDPEWKPPYEELDDDELIRHLTLAYNIHNNVTEIKNKLGEIFRSRFERDFK